jgi:hypothetical protein
MFANYATVHRLNVIADTTKYVSKLLSEYVRPGSGYNNCSEIVDQRCQRKGRSKFPYNFHGTSGEHPGHVLQALEILRWRPPYRMLSF